MKTPGGSPGAGGLFLFSAAVSRKDGKDCEKNDRSDDDLPDDGIGFRAGLRNGVDALLFQDLSFDLFTPGGRFADLPDRFLVSCRRLRIV